MYEYVCLWTLIVSHFSMSQNAGMLVAVTTLLCLRILGTLSANAQLS